MSRQFFPLQLTASPQILAPQGAPSGAHSLALAFAFAPSAGSVLIEYRLLARPGYLPAPITANLLTTAGYVLASVDGPVESFRVTFSGLVGGTAPVLWVDTSEKLAAGPTFEDRIAQGLLPGYRRVALYGNNPDVDPGTAPEDVWSGGGVYPWLTAASALEIVSSSAADAAAGTGAQSVTISGLDASYAEVVQTVAVNGATPVAIPLPLLRINAAVVASAGSGQTNAGEITIRNAGAGATRGLMPAGFGNLRQCVYTVPAGYQFVITSVLAVINRVDTPDRWGTVASWVRLESGVVRMPAEIGIGTTPYRDQYEVPAALPEKTDTAIRVQQVSGNNSDVTASILGYLRPVA